MKSIQPILRVSSEESTTLVLHLSMLSLGKVLAIMMNKISSENIILILKNQRKIPKMVIVFIVYSAFFFKDLRANIED